MKRYILIAAMVSAFAAPSQAGLSEGIAAATAGNYAQAAAEFEPLAAAGDAAAQYYLAKLYLEGHGPSNDVPRGVALMTQAAKANHPEAQAQLGLMYALGLGVTVDNAQAYDWLTKAVAALPEGSRRTVAVANRDAVLQRMTAQQRAAAGAGAAPSAQATTAPAASEPVAAAPEPEAEPETEPAPAPAPQTAAAAPSPAPAEEAATSAPATADAQTESQPESQPASESAPAEAAVVDSEPEQTASVEVPANSAAPASEDQVRAGVRIQVASLPSEDAAWAAWKQISQDFKDQVSGLTAILEKADLGEQGTYYRVQTGPFETVAAAKERCGKMKEAGLDCLVVGKE
jgi:hypothetical protein